MREVEPRRVGVKWQPPALIYVYQLGRVLRLAKIPVRNLEDEDVVNKIYEKHGEHLLQGLERRYVDRMITILRHHHGLNIEPDRLTERTCSEKQSEEVNSMTESEKNSDNHTSNCSNSIGVNRKGEHVLALSNNEHLYPNKLIAIDNKNNSRKIGQNQRNGSDILKLLNEASQSGVEENEITVKLNDADIKSTKDIANNKLQREITPQDKNNEILDLISQDLNTVQKEKQNLVNIVKTNNYDIFNSKMPTLIIKSKESTTDPESKRNTVKRKNEVKTNVEDNSEDTDLDMDDVDIPLDPEEPKRNEFDLLDDDDFWS